VANKLHIDLESKSRVDLLKEGGYNYATDLSTEILCMCYALDDAPVELWVPGQPFPEDVADYIAEGGDLYAHHAAFERLMFDYIICPDHGCPQIKLEQWFCTAYMARANNIPAALVNTARALKLPHQKQLRGRDLIKMLCIPQADGKFYSTPELLDEMYEYCRQDVEAERAACEVMRYPDETEWQDYWVSERINDRGILIDYDLAVGAQAYAEEEEAELIEVIRKTTSGEIEKARGEKLKAWIVERLTEDQQQIAVIHRKGKKVYSLSKYVRSQLLTDEHLDPDVFTVLEASDFAQRSSVGKFKAMQLVCDPEDHRVRGAFVANGASASGRYCVDGETLVESVNSPIAIKNVRKGDMVLTHTNRYREVKEVFYKGVEAMYRVETPAGFVVCTAGHRILTEKGWKHVNQLTGFAKPSDNESSDRVLYVASRNEHSGSGESLWGDAPHSNCNIEENFGARSILSAQESELFKVKNGGPKPDARRPLRQGKHTQRIPSKLDRHEIRERIEARNGESDRPHAATGNARSPHRWRSDEQRHRQPMFGERGRSRKIASTEITKVVSMGERGVWDIEVDGDHSYVAQGLIHHNSSRSAQIHNFPRESMKKPAEVRLDIVENIEPDDIRDYYKRPIMEVLSRMLRPALIPADGKRFMVSDWNAIEGRCAPWLANSELGEAKLDLYRRGVDPYKVAAMAIYNIAYDEVGDESPERRVGKVSELACTYQGGYKAFLGMGRNYGVFMSEDEAKEVVKSWRLANPWAVSWWADCERAAMLAVKQPNIRFKAGRAAYFSVVDVLCGGATLFCELPCGRLLTYPDVRLEDKETPWGEMRPALTALRAAFTPKAGAKEWPRTSLYSGIFAENICQGTAASLLRAKLREADEVSLPVVAHIHDELIVESGDDKDIEILHTLMNTTPDWAEGLPLKADVKEMIRFGK